VLKKCLIQISRLKYGKIILILSNFLLKSDSPCNPMAVFATILRFLKKNQLWGDYLRNNT
jgi:hypothetical protein